VRPLDCFVTSFLAMTEIKGGFVICERSDAIQRNACGHGLLRHFVPRNDGTAYGSVLAVNAMTRRVSAPASGT